MVDIESARDRFDRLDRIQRPEHLTAVRPRPATTTVVHTMSRTEKHVKDVIWTAVISIALACVALIAGVAGVLFTRDLTQLAEGAGLASIAFGLAGISDKLDAHRYRREG